MVQDRYVGTVLLGWPIQHLMKASTRVLHETLIRALKGMIRAYDEWLKAAIKEDKIK